MNYEAALFYSVPAIISHASFGHLAFYNGVVSLYSLQDRSTVSASSDISLTLPQQTQLW